MNFVPRGIASIDRYAEPCRSNIDEFPNTNIPAAPSGGERAKRFLDLCLTLVLLPVALICALPIALIIAMQGGKPIYRHLRVGRNGRSFFCYKFRTMVLDADRKLQELLLECPEARREWREQFKLENDPRVTRFGWLLRKTSLDEIPQIWNVIRGDMSWVGPRPIIADELAKYGANVPSYFACRPGITGLWQVNGRSDTTYEQRIAFDVLYAERWSILLDLKILALTIPRVLSAKGSY